MIIGHARASEHGTANGSPGDQTGGEVCITPWTNSGWTDVLRPKIRRVAELMVWACKAGCNNDNIGYSQNQRNTLHQQAILVDYDLSKVPLCNTDCSAFMTVCVEAAGLHPAYTNTGYGENAPVTWNMVDRFMATGAFEHLTGGKYTKSPDWLKAGDVLVKNTSPGGHTAMALEDGIKTKEEIDMTTAEFINSLTGEQAHAIAKKAREYAGTLSGPAWDEKHELAEAVNMGITDGTRPEADVTRAEAAIMSKRAVNAILAAMKDVVEEGK